MLNFILGTAILQCLLFSAFLLTGSRRAKYSNKYFAFLLIALSLGFLDHYFQSNFAALEHPNLFFIFNFSGLLIAPLLYLYSRSVIEYSHTYKHKDLLNFMPFVMFSLFIVFQYHILSIAEKTEFLSRIESNYYFIYIIPILGYLCILFFITKAIALLKSNAKSNKKAVTKARKHSLTVLTFVIFGYLGIVTLSIIDILISKVISSETLYFYYDWVVVVSWFVFSLLTIYHGLTYPSAFDTLTKSQKYQNSALLDETKLKYKKSILDCIENDKPYFNSQITINDFSKQCHITPKYLSQVLNEEFGMSFFDFINSQRIEFVKLQFQNNTNSRIIDVAYESGFNSKAAFNRAFKKKQGCTPTEYLKNLK